MALNPNTPKAPEFVLQANRIAAKELEFAERVLLDAAKRKVRDQAGPVQIPAEVAGANSD